MGRIYRYLDKRSYSIDISYEELKSVRKDCINIPYRVFFVQLTLFITIGIIFNFIASAVVEYKYMFHKYCGINARLNLNKLEIIEDKSLSFLSLESSLEWIYGRKGKHIFSGSFSPFGVAYAQQDDGSRADDFCKKCWTLGFVLLKYEYDRRFYLNFGKVKIAWYSLKDISWKGIGFFLLSIEFGLNIIGVNNWRKKRKENIV
jgi:hypothetical protein